MLRSTIFISVLVLCCIDCSYGTAIETHPNVNLLPDSCGDVNGTRYSDSRIAGLYEFPWMALISYHSRDGHQFRCTGTIINSKYILTAAHCVTKNYKIGGVRIGEYDLRYKTDCQGEEPHLVCESHLQDIPVENIIPHQNFSRLPAPMNDVALIRLLTPIDFKYRNALPICLPVTKELRNAVLAGTTGIIAGWGLMEANRNVLSKDYILVKNDKDCKSLIYNNELLAGGSERVLREICAGGNEKDSCRGDGGSPLMVQGLHEGVNRYIQYGIVSRGPIKCGSQPAVYTDVTKYMGWILDNIKE